MILFIQWAVAQRQSNRLLTDWLEVRILPAQLVVSSLAMSDDDYGHGLLEGVQRQYIADRVAAFGAIRRALEVARRHDDRVELYLGTIRKHVQSGNFVHDDYLIEVETSANNAWHHAECADTIRRAIRAAIGSPKQ